MALRRLGTQQGHFPSNYAADNDLPPLRRFPTCTADNDSLSSSSESDGNEADSEPDASTEEGLAPADKHNIIGPNSDRPITSLPFVEWPDEVRQQMLISVLVKEDESIIPYYHEGSVEGDSEETKKPNYDIAMLLATAGEPRLYQEALEIFYSRNVWEFKNPRVALWWLKKLGTKVAMLRHINIELTQGRWGIGSTPLEKLWYILIVWMKPRIELHTIEVSFEKWDYALVHRNDEPPAKYFPVAESRLGVWSTLLSFRGLKTADIAPGPFVSYGYAVVLSRSMILIGNQVDAGAQRLKRRWRRKVYPWL